ncbi:hypothetical protein [Georgenia yuyongxinii]|uniref:Uncharacterized protein n=1 Tax=Georgenia yuyongxinii TaxID=2589797 RepID=A0A552WS00_9MICO|nr:hypothetical protein [Georgenia yuyongxinii]TRW45608.1 hypothetical protein FJ693_08735 [Georgenia yuyongxinii]
MTPTPTVPRPALVEDALIHRGLVQPEGVNATERTRVRDVLSGGKAGKAPRTDADAKQYGPDAELVGAGPDKEEDFVHGDSGQDDGSID